MKYQETGFRALYKNFAAFPLNDRFRKAMEGYPNVDAANCMLVYGYIDHEAGLTLEVLAAGVEREERFKFFDPSEDTRFITTEDMGEYGQHFSKVQKHFLEVISLARNNEKNVAGIVINAFTEPWVLDSEIFDLVENMKSRLVQEYPISS